MTSCDDDAGALTLSLAERAPDAYRRRYASLGVLERVAYLRTLRDEDYPAHIEPFYADLARQLGGPGRFHLEVTHRAHDLLVSYSLEGAKSSQPRLLGELRCGPERFAVLRRWILDKGLARPRMTVQVRGMSASPQTYEARLEALRSYYPNARLVGVSVREAEPYTERGEIPHGALRVLAELVDEDGIELDAVLSEQPHIDAETFAVEAPKARAFAQRVLRSVGSDASS